MRVAPEFCEVSCLPTILYSNKIILIPKRIHRSYVQLFSKSAFYFYSPSCVDSPTIVQIYRLVCNKDRSCALKNLRCNSPPMGFS